MRLTSLILILVLLSTGSGCQTMGNVNKQFSQAFSNVAAEYDHVKTGSDSNYIHGQHAQL